MIHSNCLSNWKDLTCGSYIEAGIDDEGYLKNHISFSRGDLFVCLFV